MVKHSDTPCCRHCPHSQSMKNAVEIGKVIYMCKAGPPQIVPVPIGGGRVALQAHWPTTGPDDWCDEHPRRKTQIEERPLVALEDDA